MSTILGIESTCDETGAAIVVNGVDVRSNVVASQVEIHAKYRGVVPEIASRAHIENILPVLREAIDTAGCRFADLDAIAVAHRPGLIGSLLIGVTAAKTLAWSLGKPLVGVDHVRAHLYSVMLGDQKTNTTNGSGSGHPERYSAKDLASIDESARCFGIPQHDKPHASAETEKGGVPIYLQSRGDEKEPGPLFPAVGLVVSGGHTSLYLVNSWTDISRIGSTIDDAVGEAYDKVAAILGLGYPGGPLIDKLAADGDPKAIRFPRSLFGRESLDFSFSGLKTSVLYCVRGVPGKEGDTGVDLTEENIRNIAASFQAACVDVIVQKLDRAVRQTRAKCVIVGGGVSANRGLRAALAKFAVPVHFPQMAYCTDNAAMSAGLANVLLSQGVTAGLDLDACPSS